MMNKIQCPGCFASFDTQEQFDEHRRGYHGWHPVIPAERHKVEMRLDLDAIERRIRLAHEKVRALCSGDERWTMRVPADEHYDHDLIISAALRDADTLLIAVRSLLEQKP